MSADASKFLDSVRDGLKEFKKLLKGYNTCDDKEDQEDLIDDCIAKLRNDLTMLKIKAKKIGDEAERDSYVKNFDDCTIESEELKEKWESLKNGDEVNFDEAKGDEEIEIKKKDDGGNGDTNNDAHADGDDDDDDDEKKPLIKEKHSWHWLEGVLIVGIIVGISFFIVDISNEYIPNKITTIIAAAFGVLAGLFVWNFQTSKDLHDVVEKFEVQRKELKKNVKKFQNNNKTLVKNTAELRVQKELLSKNVKALGDNADGLDGFKERQQELNARGRKNLEESQKITEEIHEKIYEADKQCYERSLQDIVSRVFSQFRHLDEDRSNHLEGQELEEMKQVLATHYGIPWKPTYDTDGDGKLSKKELKLIIRAHFRDLQETLKKNQRLEVDISKLRFEVTKSGIQQSRKEEDLKNKNLLEQYMAEEEKRANVD